MNVQLAEVRKEYESMSDTRLVMCAESAGIEVVGKTREQVLDELMAIEEYACFH
jgi:hypothetical protein